MFFLIIYFILHLNRDGNASNILYASFSKKDSGYEIAQIVSQTEVVVEFEPVEPDVSLRPSGNPYN